MIVEREITLGDEVKNTNFNDIFGRVIAKYRKTPEGPELLDIRSENRIYYGTSISNWKTTRPVEDIE